MAEVSPLLVAALSDRYVVERELGHGGMATIYLWRHADPELQPYLEEARAELARTTGEPTRP